MTPTTHRFDHYDDIAAAAAHPALVPELPAAEGGPAGIDVAWLRATVARFSSGASHRRRRALVEAELARLDPAELRRAVAARPEGEVRTRVVRTLAEALGMPEPGAVAEAVTVVAGAYFGGADAAADEAVARLVASLVPASADEGALEAAAARIGLLVQACAATAALVEAAAAAGSDVPVARVLRQAPPVPAMRRVAACATRVGGREIAEGDRVLLDLSAANRVHPVPLAFGAPPRACPGRPHALALADGLLRRPRTAFAALHDQEAPLLLPNAWDCASAAVLAAQGFPAIGTTSLGVAAAAGLPDGAAATAEETLALARRLKGGSFLFTVDIEGGFSDDPQAVAELAARLHEAGAAGINLEDGRADGTLAPVGAHAAKIAAVKVAVPPLFVNARTDTHWLGCRLEETGTRLAEYEQAGADGAFVPGLSAPDGIASLVATLTVPLNILYTPNGPTVTELAALGVRRISLGSLLYRTALAAAAATASAVRDGRQVEPAPLSYAQVQALGASAGAPRPSRDASAG
ncbi:isocitrate lyase/phosphoenolpyruvate mutase family protein [Actinacidiphila sp. bgisy167]|uniref:isocitrate lyase/phosphoenolpyruvate mutase family protein n=1 Tax=Actinacidiphila sp. bgisy167 TaxID=3413797 RepID=UPI003D732354